KNVEKELNWLPGNNYNNNGRPQRYIPPPQPQPYIQGGRNWSHNINSPGVHGFQQGGQQAGSESNWEDQDRQQYR
ncbi:MAG: hypothetical protein ACLSDO_11680, partial [Anaerotruncus colihominis]